MAKRVSDLPTPCFLVDIHKVQENAQRMVETCKKFGVKLRAHTKTHKTLEGALLQTNGTKRCIAVSTLPEAELYAENGFEDILFAFPVTEDKMDRILVLVRMLKEFHVMVCGDEGLKCLENHIKDLPDGKVWSIMLEIDAGYARTGYLWSNDRAILEAARKVTASPKMRLDELYYHCGSTYHVSTHDAREEMQNAHIDRMLHVQEMLKANGIDCPSGIGSTPTCSLPIAKNSKLTEFHPGNYIFYDYQQCLLNTCRESNIACRVMTRVIAHKPEKHMILVDCGFLGIGHDGMHQRPSDFCLIQGEHSLKFIGMTQEIGKIIAKEGDLDCSLYPVGTILYIFPYHSCPAANLHSVYHVHSGDEVISTWKPVRGW